MKFTGERYIPIVEGWQALQHYHRYYFVINEINLKDKTVLDIACGEGYGSNILARSAGFVFGIDNSEEAINNAQNTYPNINSSFLTGNVASIPLDDKSIDVAVSFETIEHHDLHIEMMQEIKRVLKKNGILIISSPDKGFYEKYFPDYTNEFHVKELYHDEFKSLIEKYFRHSEFFLQNNIQGSLIAAENMNCSDKTPIHIEKSSGNFEYIEPRFNICMASDIKIKPLHSVSICTPSFYHDIYQLINDIKVTVDKKDKVIRDQNVLIENIYKSNIWKIGKLITYPLRRVKKFNK